MGCPLVEPTLLVTSLAGCIASGTFLAAGLNLRRRAESRHAREAVDLFSLWWVALSVYAVAGATLDLSAAVGVVAPGPALVFRFVQAIALCIGLWGLVYYIAFIFTGRRSLLPTLAVFLSLYYGAILFYVALGRPVALAVEAWRAQLAYDGAVVDGASSVLLLVVPPLVASATYLFVLVKARELSQRWRIVLASASTVAWFAAVLLRDGEAGPASLAPLLGLLSAFAITWAYRPPAWVHRRLAAGDAPGASLD